MANIPIRISADIASIGGRRISKEQRKVLATEFKAGETNPDAAMVKAYVQTGVEVPAEVLEAHPEIQIAGIPLSEV